jgi:hypothetical protein
METEKKIRIVGIPTELEPSSNGKRRVVIDCEYGNVKGVYIGEYENRFHGSIAIDGKGKIEYANGNSYEGDFVDGHIEGFGTFMDSNNGRYDGEFKDGNMHGNGKLIFPNGDVYEGDFVENHMEGTGTYECPGSYCYKGEWKDSEKHGSGELIFSNGDRYVGNFTQNNTDGAGKYIYPNGSIVEQFYAKGKKMEEFLMSRAFYDRERNIIKEKQKEQTEPIGERRVILNRKFQYNNDELISSQVIYNIYGVSGKIERSFGIDYGLAGQLSEDEIYDIDDLFARGVIADVTAGIENKERITTFGEARSFFGEAVGQILEDSALTNGGILDPEEVMEADRLLGLANLSNPNELKGVLSSNPEQNESRIKKFTDDRLLVQEFSHIVGNAIRDREEEFGVQFDEKTKQNINRKYIDDLKNKIEHGPDGEQKESKKITTRIEIFHSLGNRLKEELSQAMVVEVKKRWYQRLIDWFAGWLSKSNSIKKSNQRLEIKKINATIKALDSTLVSKDKVKSR